MDSDPPRKVRMKFHQRLPDWAVSKPIRPIGRDIDIRRAAEGDLADEASCRRTEIVAAMAMAKREDHAWVTRGAADSPG